MTLASFHASTQAGVARLGIERDRKIAVLVGVRGNRRLTGGGRRLGAALGRVVAPRESLEIGDLVVEGERDGNRPGRAVAVDQDFEPPGFERIETRIGGQHEQSGVLLALDALGERIEQPVIALHEGEGLVVLDDAKAIETIAFGRDEKLLAEKIVRALRGEEDRLRVVGHVPLVVFEIHHADEVAADRGRREQRGGEGDVETGVLGAERDVELGAGGTVGLERCRDLARRHLPARNGTGGEQRLPGLAAEGVDVERRPRRRCRGAPSAGAARGRR